MNIHSPKWYREGREDNCKDSNIEYLVGTISHDVHIVLDSLQERDIALLETHSLRNMLHVIWGNIQLVWFLVQDGDRELTKSRNECEYILSQLSEMNPKIDWETSESVIFGEIAESIDTATLTDTEKIEYETSMQILKEMFPVFWFRINEFLQRRIFGDGFAPFFKQGIIRDLRNVFWLMAKNSKGRYGFVFDEPEKAENDYRITIDILDQGKETETISFPMVFSDIFRDLLANSRKYSPVGSTIHGSIIQETDDLVFRVTDHGRWIPEQELSRIGEYGYRASNVRDDVRGFWYGLTKAFYYAQKFGGTVRIRSKEGIGTGVEIRIPRPLSSDKPVSE